MNFILLILDYKISRVLTLLIKILSLCPKSIGSIANGLTDKEVLMKASGLLNSNFTIIDYAEHA